MTNRPEMSFLDTQIAAFKASMEGRIDFAGQAKAENLSRQILWTVAVIAFVVGCSLQSLQITLGIFTVGFLGCCVVVLPPYPAYNSNPVKWLPTLSDEGKLLDESVVPIEEKKVL